MKTETQSLNKHYFRAIAGDGQEFASYGDTIAEAQSQFSQNGEGYEHSRSEQIPYKHAERAQEIAAVFPGKWTAIPQSKEYADCGWTLQRADGLALYMNGPSYNHRNSYRFGVSAPRHDGSYVCVDEKANSINCGETKTAEQMAKDISRRLIPDAELVYAATVAKIGRMKESANAQVESLLALRKAFGMTPPEKDRHTGRFWTNLSFNGGSAEIHDGGNVTFKLYSIEPAKAAKLAAAFKSLGLA